MSVTPWEVEAARRSESEEARGLIGTLADRNGGVVPTLGRFGGRALAFFGYLFDGLAHEFPGVFELRFSGCEIEVESQEEERFMWRAWAMIHATLLDVERERLRRERESKGR